MSEKPLTESYTSLEKSYSSGRPTNDSYNGSNSGKVTPVMPTARIQPVNNNNNQQGNNKK